MTDEQKRKVKELSEAGLSYSNISERLGISRSTIASFCQKHLEEEVLFEKKKTDTCRFCGKKLTFTDGKRKKIFCSQSCRLSWWAKHPEMKNRKAFYSFTCQTCGSVFSAYGNKNRHYCSRQCYIQDRFNQGGNTNDSAAV